jgi:hypothetical protein
MIRRQRDMKAPKALGLRAGSRSREACVIHLQDKGLSPKVSRSRSNMIRTSLHDSRDRSADRCGATLVGVAANNAAVNLRTSESTVFPIAPPRVCPAAHLQALSQRGFDPRRTEPIRQGQ